MVHTSDGQGLTDPASSECFLWYFLGSFSSCIRLGNEALRLTVKRHVVGDVRVLAWVSLMSAAAALLLLFPATPLHVVPEDHRTEVS